jgi:hypothetical protein
LRRKPIEDGRTRPAFSALAKGGSKGDGHNHPKGAVGDESSDCRKPVGRKLAKGGSRYGKVRSCLAASVGPSRSFAGVGSAVVCQSSVHLAIQAESPSLRRAIWGPTGRYHVFQKRKAWIPLSFGSLSRLIGFYPQVAAVLGMRDRAMLETKGTAPIRQAWAMATPVSGEPVDGV